MGLAAANPIHFHNVIIQLRRQYTTPSSLFRRFDTVTPLKKSVNELITQHHRKSNSTKGIFSKSGNSFPALTAPEIGVMLQAMLFLKSIT